MKLILITCLLMICSLKTNADMGDCIRYDVKITLNNGDTLSGVIQLIAYFDINPTQVDKDSLLFDLYKRNRKKFYLYNQVQCINFPQPNVDYIDNTKYEKLSAAPNENIQVVEFSNIKSIDFIKSYLCKCEKIESQKYYFGGFNSIIITDLTQKEIDLLQEKPLSQTLIMNSVGPDFYILLNYNTKLKESEIKELYQQFKTEELPKNNSKEMLRAQKIVVIYNEFGTW